MNIGIIGAGSIGLLFSAYLSEYHQVELYTRTTEQAKFITTHGIQMEYVDKDKVPLHVQVSARPLIELKADKDVYILAVKQYHLQGVMEHLKRYKINGNFIFLQNGLGHLKQINNLLSEEIFVGTVEHGALRTSLNTVIHTGIGTTRLAALKGDLKKVKAIFQNSNKLFSVCYEKDAYEMLVKKFVVNAVINPLTAVLKVTNGELISNLHFYRLMQDVFKEVCEVMQIIERVAYFDRLIEICQKTATNRSSMLKDIDENRQTEIESILGYLLEKAKRERVATPISLVLYECIKGMELKG